MRASHVYERSVNLCKLCERTSNTHTHSFQCIFFVKTKVNSNRKAVERKSLWQKSHKLFSLLLYKSTHTHTETPTHSLLLYARLRVFISHFVLISFYFQSHFLGIHTSQMDAFEKRISHKSKTIRIHADAYCILQMAIGKKEILYNIVFARGR